MASDRIATLMVVGVLAAAWLACDRRTALARAGGWLAVLTLAAMIGARWYVAGRPPVFGTFETNLAETFCLLVASLWVDRQVGGRFLRGPLAVAAVTMLHTFLLRNEITPLTISEQSVWIDIHAPLAWLTWSFYFCAVFLAHAPNDSRDLGLRFLALGFTTHSALGFVGVYFGSVLFATAWSWDPVQTIGLLSWILFAIALHFRLFFGVSMFRQRRFLLLLIVVFVLSAKAIMFFPPGQSFHVFELGNMATQEIAPGVE